MELRATMNIQASKLLDRAAGELDKIKGRQHEAELIGAGTKRTREEANLMGSGHVPLKLNNGKM